MHKKWNKADVKFIADMQNYLRGINPRNIFYISNIKFIICLIQTKQPREHKAQHSAFGLLEKGQSLIKIVNCFYAVLHLLQICK